MFSSLIKNQKLLAVLNKLKFIEPTTVQFLTIPPAIEGKDLVVQASTGSGKTLAFALPILSIMYEVATQEKIDYTFSLIVSPTRELAVQIKSVFESLDKNLSPVLLIGGMPSKKQQNSLKQDPRIVVGTPGRILDFLERRLLKIRDLELLVLDEADEMFSMGFYQDIETLLSKIPEHTQGLFVSATISERIDMLAKRHLRDPIKIEGSTLEEVPPQIEHLYCNVGNQTVDKPNAVCSLIDKLNPTSAIIFCNTKSETEVVEAFLRRRNVNASRLNSDLNQNQRNKILEEIRSQKVKFLIATDIAARGIDIDHIDLVVNMGIPEQAENYVHRIGRTGRAGRAGKAISLVGAFDFINFKNLRKATEIDFVEMVL